MLTFDRRTSQQTSILHFLFYRLVCAWKLTKGIAAEFNCQIWHTFIGRSLPRFIHFIYTSDLVHFSLVCPLLFALRSTVVLYCWNMNFWLFCNTLYVWWKDFKSCERSLKSYYIFSILFMWIVVMERFFITSAALVAWKKTRYNAIWNLWTSADIASNRNFSAFAKSDWYMLLSMYFQWLVQYLWNVESQQTERLFYL